MMGTGCAGAHVCGHTVDLIVGKLSIILIFHCYTDSSGDQLNRAFVQYSFSGKPHQILQKPHGNSKSARPFVRMTPSTLQKLKECCKTNQPPKQGVSNVTKEKGGIINAKPVGDIPRNHRQVYNMKQPKGDDSDALSSIMAMCKQSMDKDEEPFVWMVTSAPEPMCVLCTDNQLSDIDRFVQILLVFAL